MQRTAWLRALAITALVSVAPFTPTAKADAAAAHGTVPGAPTSAEVGEVIDATVSIVNTSTAPEAGGTHGISDVLVVPSCGATGPMPSGDCSSPDPGVFEPPNVATGRAGSACGGTSFTTAPVASSTTGRFRLTPSVQIQLAQPGSELDTCVIEFQMTVLDIPATDVFGAAGVQTTMLASSAGTSNAVSTSTSFSAGAAAITIAAPAAEPPGIRVVKTATPLSRPAPGGTFSFAVAVTNIGDVTVTLTGIVDDVYGNLATQGTCTNAVGTVLEPGASYTCTFSGELTGTAGTTQTDVVTVTAQDPDGTAATDSDDAVVSITQAPTTTSAPPTTTSAPPVTTSTSGPTPSTTKAPATTTTAPRLAATGASSRTTGLLAGALVGLGLLITGFGVTASERGRSVRRT